MPSKHKLPRQRKKPAPFSTRDLATRILLVLVPVALVVVGVVSVAPVSTSPTSSGRLNRDSHAQLERRLQALERRVAALEGQQSPDPTDPTSDPEPSPTDEPTSEPTEPTDPPTTDPPDPDPTTPPTTPPTDPPTDPPPAGGFPTVGSTGLPSGWSPVRTVQGSYTVSNAGAVVEDLRINGDLVISAPNVVVRRVEVVGGTIDNFRGRTCANGLVIEDSTIRESGSTSDDGTPAVGAGGYTAENVLIDGAAEGFRVGGKGSDCGPVTISDSYARVVAPTSCGDWHGDGIQGYGGAELTVRNSVLVLDERRGCGGTAPFFYPESQGNTSVDIDGLVVEGGGYPFRLGTAGRVENLNIVEGWGYGPLEVRCSLVSSWDAQIVTLDSAGQPVTVRNQPCGGS